MSALELLSAVHAPEGWRCVVGIKNKRVIKKFVESAEEVIQAGQQLVDDGFDAYYACATFKEPTTRSGDNTKEFRALWLDIDCGTDKPYEDQTQGIAALKTFCKDNALPRPTLVNSGRGIHAYWTFKTPVAPAVWQPTADRLKALCEEGFLSADPACTADKARILRLPDTKNLKDPDDPLDVTLLYTGEPVDFEELRQTLGVLVFKEEVPDFLPRQVNELTKSLANNREFHFKTILIKTDRDFGCNQIKYITTHQQEMSEPIWRAGLSVAQYCVDRDVAIHAISKNYEQYDPDETEKKANRIKGPYGCATFEKFNPGGCDECIHKGKIKSPILLGLEIAEATTNEIIEEAKDDEPAIVHSVPEYPFPYFRGKAGGVYKRPISEEEDAQVVYEHDLYVVRRMVHPIEGEMVVFKLHLPQDGVKEFSVPLTSVVVKEKLREALAEKGVAATAKQQELLLGYIMTFVKELQVSRKADKMRTQFGWCDGDSKFIVGDREITATGIHYSPPSASTDQFAPNMVAIGEFDKWKECFNVYGKEGLEPYAYAALTAFGSPLLKFTGIRGAAINLISGDSGPGKSTILRVINSVIGKPTELMSMWKDTQNAVARKLAIFNNLCHTYDEVTKVPAEDIGSHLYQVTQGRDKERAQASVNQLRSNTERWELIEIMTSNASLYDKLQIARDSVDGEMMRVFEYVIYSSGLDEQYAKQMFDVQLESNYGHAADIYFSYLVSNKDYVINMVRSVQAKIDKEVRLTSRERFWSALIACNIAGGLIAKELGLHDFNMRNIYVWVTEQIHILRQHVRPPLDNVASVIGDYIGRHMQNILVVNAEVDSRTQMSAAPILEPKGPLYIRYEPDSKRMYINAKHFRADCAKAQITYRELTRKLEKDKVLINSEVKRITKGMKITAPPVYCLVFDCTNGNFLDVEEMIVPADASTPS